MADPESPAGELLALTVYPGDGGVEAGVLIGGEKYALFFPDAGSDPADAATVATRAGGVKACATPARLASLLLADPSAEWFCELSGPRPNLGPRAYAGASFTPLRK